MTSKLEETHEWGTRTMADGRKIPEIGIGSWKQGNGDACVDQLITALDVGFEHIDTAQVYRNETEVGDALRLSEIEPFLTTKWSGSDGKDAEQSIHESLEMLGRKSVDLYLIHAPSIARSHGGIIDAWRKMEKIQDDGLAKSIGVSNYGIAELEEIRLSGAKLPVINQVILHPYVYARQIPLLLYHLEHNIITEAYSTLLPITQLTGGAVDKPIKSIADRQGITPGEVLFAWARSKGAVVITSSRSKERLETYKRAGELVLTKADIISIDIAGAKGAPKKFGCVSIESVVKIFAACAITGSIAGALMVVSELVRQ